MITKAYALWQTYDWAGPLFSYQGRDLRHQRPTPARTSSACCGTTSRRSPRTRPTRLLPRPGVASTPRRSSPGRSAARHRCADRHHRQGQGQPGEGQGQGRTCLRPAGRRRLERRPRRSGPAQALPSRGRQLAIRLPHPDGEAEQPRPVRAEPEGASPGQAQPGRVPGPSAVPRLAQHQAVELACPGASRSAPSSTPATPPVGLRHHHT